MVEARTEEGWEFMFLGANIDAVGEAARIGISPDRATEYVSDGIGTNVMYGAVAVTCWELGCAPAGSRIGSARKRLVERDVARRR